MPKVKVPFTIYQKKVPFTICPEFAVSLRQHIFFLYWCGYTFLSLFGGGQHFRFGVASDGQQLNVCPK